MTSHYAARALVARSGLPTTDHPALADSDKRFADGAAYRIEIPSVEGPACLSAVVDAAEQHGVTIDRVSQGSGIMLQTDTEIEEMVALGARHRIEVCLFVGPRAGWDIGAQAVSRTGPSVAPCLRGTEQLVHALEDVARGCELGLRSVLIADLGLLQVLAELKGVGELPGDLVLKTSVALPAANPAAARVLETLGATTINVPSDLTLAQIAGIRAATDVPLDIYVESPEDIGGFVRHHEIAELVRVAAPVHLKFAVRNAPALYPAGLHHRDLLLALMRERVRRAAIGLALLHRTSSVPDGPAASPAGAR